MVLTETSRLLIVHELLAEVIREDKIDQLMVAGLL
jgi:hypothetical protein